MLATLGAVVIGGAISIAGTLIAQERQNAREDQKAKDDARDAARVLYGEILAASAVLDGFEREVRLRKFDSTLRVDLSDKDRRLLAGELDENRWATVSVGLAQLQALEGAVNGWLARGQKRLTPQQQCMVRWDRRALFAAAGAAATLAEIPGPGASTPDPSCDPGYGQIAVLP